MKSDDLLVLAEMADAEPDPIAKMMLTAAVQAKELARTRELAEHNARRLTKIEGDVEDMIFSNNNYCTVIGFCSLIGVRNVGREVAAEHGRRLRRLAQNEGFEGASRLIFDPIYGRVNAWHFDLLNLYFGTDVPRPMPGGSVR